MGKFTDILAINSQYQEVKDNLNKLLSIYKDHPTEENLNLMVSSFNSERELYKSLWHQYQSENGLIETITEYDYINIINDKLPEDAEYKKKQYDRFKSGDFKFTSISRVKEEYIFDYHKIFINNSTFQAVNIIENGHREYTDHVKEVGRKFYIDKDNKILLIIQ